MSLRWRIDAAGGALELWVAQGGEAADDAQARDVVESFCWRLECGDPEALRVAVAIEEAVRGYISPALGWEAPVHALERSALGRRLAFKVKSAFWSGLIGAGRWRPTSVGIDEPEDDVLVLTPPEAPPKPETDKEPTWYEVRVVDELGESIAGLPLVLEVDGKHPLVTDGDGRVRLDGTYPSMGHARIEDLATLRELVRPRWDQIRPGDWLAPEPDHSFIPLRGSEAIVRSVFSETLHTLVIQPWVIRARLIGMYFDTSKCFLLPSALGDIKKLKKLYDEYPDSEILVVGHTDKTGDPSYNDPLSLERADSVAAYMQDDVDAWLSWYGYGKDYDKRWGAKEDQYMLQSLPDYDTRQPGESAVWWFQRTRGLGLDGWAGDETRRQLITEYMAHDGTTLPTGAHITKHGCGESFPFTDEELAELDLLDADPDQRDRRVELYFFDRPLGVEPPPPGNISAPGSLEYPEWGKRAQETHDFSLRMVKPVIRFDDPLLGACAQLDILLAYPDGSTATITTDSHGCIEVPKCRFPYVDTRYERGTFTQVRRVFLDLPPEESIEGAWQRLVNLGYTDLDIAPAAPAEPYDLKRALCRFQAEFCLSITGEPDAATTARLAEEHASPTPWQLRQVPYSPDGDTLAANPKGSPS